MALQQTVNQYYIPIIIKTSIVDVYHIIREIHITGSSFYSAHVYNQIAKIILINQD